MRKLWSSLEGSVKEFNVPNRVARFFLIQYTKMGQSIPTYHLISKWPKNIPIGGNIFQMAIKRTNIFHSKALQNLSKLGYLV
jgi:hypothetical protein